MRRVASWTRGGCIAKRKIFSLVVFRCAAGSAPDFIQTHEGVIQTHESEWEAAAQLPGVVRFSHLDRASAASM